MIHSADPEIAAAGARRICLISLDIEEAQGLAKECISGTTAQRIGAASIFAVNLHLARLREYCEKILKDFFHDPDEQVQKAAADFVRHLNADEIQEYSDLIEAFVESPSYLADSYFLTRILEESINPLSEIMLKVAERFLDVAGDTATDIQSRNSLEASAKSKLVLRGYNHSNEADLRSRYLDMIDRMLRIRVHGLDNIVSSFER